MIFCVEPTKKLRGSVQLPASKSYSIRAFIVAACGGKTEIIRPSNCDDALVAMNVAKNLGANLIKKPNGWAIEAKVRNRSIKAINVRESGTALRFILPLLALKGEPVIIEGKGTLIGRPNTYLIDALRAMGSDITGKGSEHSVPLMIQQSNIRGGKIDIDGSLSSQFISALLITCPQLPQDSVIRLKGKKIVSEDYITMTLQILDKAGVKIDRKGVKQFNIKGDQKFKGLKKFAVPSDYGLAAFHLAAAALVPSQITLKGTFLKDFIQADGQIMPFLKQMGVKYSQTNKNISMKGPFTIKGGTFSLKNCPDLVPIMAVLALFANKKTRLTHIEHARLKESDRISDLRKELLKIGAQVEEKKNELIIVPVEEYKTNVTLDPHNDHRLAMAFSVLGLKIGVKVKNIVCVNKSYPDFISDFIALGAQAKKCK